MHPLVETKYCLANFLISIRKRTFFNNFALANIKL